MTKLRYPLRFDFLRRAKADTANTKAPTKNWRFEKLEDRHVMSADPLTAALGGDTGADADAGLAAPVVSAAVTPGDFPPLLLQGPNIPTDPALALQWHLFNPGAIDIGGGIAQEIFGIAGQDANVVGAWRLGVTGEGVTVAVVDSGVQLDHPDLIANLSTTLGLNAITNTSRADGLLTAGEANLFDPFDGPHGTAVAGIIAADDNGIGSVGVAFDATIVPIQVLAGPLNVFNPDAVVNAFQFQNDEIDIFNHSFGAQDPLFRTTFRLSDAERNALAESVENGRPVDVNGDGVITDGSNGTPDELLGNIHIVASGNAAGSVLANPNLSGVEDINDLADYEEFVNSRFTIAVGGVDHDGELSNADGTVTDFAEAGASVLLVAPTGSNVLSIGDEGLGGSLPIQNVGSGILTTDFVPTDPTLPPEIAVLLEGFNAPTLSDDEQAGSLNGGPEGNDVLFDTVSDSSLTGRFSGTSAAAPVVAGVVALILDANPNLTQRDVQEILVRSSRQNAITETIADGNDLGFGTSLPQTWTVNRNEFFHAPDFAGTDGIGVLDLFDDTRGDVDGDFLDSAVGSPETLLFNPEIVPDQLTTSADGALVTTTNTIDPSRFSNGSGFTVSQGRGPLGTAVGFAHGVVDAELAVRLALQWTELNQHVGAEFSFTTGVQQPSATETAPLTLTALGTDTVNDIQIPGGFSDDADGLPDDEVTVVNELFQRTPNADVLDDPLGFGSDFLPFLVPETVELSGVVTDNNIVIDWVEVVINNPTFNADTARLTLVSPDGTHSELTQHFDIQNVNFGAQAVNDTINGGGFHANVVGTPGASTPFLGSSYTFSTNRNWGERSDTSLLIDPATGLPYDNLAERGWQLHVENFDGGNDFAGFELIFHGRQIGAETQRIQGRIGVDELQQDVLDIDGDGDTDEFLADGEFNFDRYLQVVGDHFLASAVLLEDQADDSPEDAAVVNRIDTSNSTLAVFDQEVIDPFTGLPTIVQQTFSIADESLANSDLAFNRLGELDRVLDAENIEAYAENVIVNLFADVWDESSQSVVFASVPAQQFLTGADGNYFFDVVPPAVQFVTDLDPALAVERALFEATVQDGDVVQYRITIDDSQTGREIVETDINAVEVDPTTGLLVLVDADDPQNLLFDSTGNQVFADPLTGEEVLADGTPVAGVSGVTVPRVLAEGEMGEPDLFALPQFQAEYSITLDYFLAEDHVGVSPEFVTIETAAFANELQLFSLIDGTGSAAVFTSAEIVNDMGMLETMTVGVTAAFEIDPFTGTANNSTPVFFATELITDPITGLQSPGDLLLDINGEPIVVEYEIGGLLQFVDAAGTPLLIIQDDLSLGGGEGVNDLYFFAADNIDIDAVDPGLGITIQLGFGDDGVVGEFDNDDDTGSILTMEADGSGTLISNIVDSFNFTTAAVDAMGVVGDAQAGDGRLDLVAQQNGAFVTIVDDISGTDRFAFAGIDHGRGTIGSGLPIFAAPQVDIFDLEFSAGDATLGAGVNGGTFTLDPTTVRTALAEQVIGANGDLGLAPVPFVAAGGFTVVDDVDNVNFLLRQTSAAGPATFTGAAFIDNNADGVFNAGDTPADGVQVFVDVNISGEFEDGIDIAATTDASGQWVLQAPVASDTGQAFRLRVEPPAGFEVSSPDTLADDFFLFATPGETVATAVGGAALTFALAPIGGDGGDGGGPGGGGPGGGGPGGGGPLDPDSISGVVFEDLDGNGVQDVGEPGVGGVTVFLDLAGDDGTFVDLEQTTAVDGSYQFSDLAADEYVVQLEAGPTLVQTSPDPAVNGGVLEVTLAAGGSVGGVNFGVEDLAVADFGDLEGPGFPTLLADNGARHEIVEGFFLGSATPDGELDGQPTALADGDDNNRLDDEDGVVATFGDDDILAPGEQISLDITVAGNGFTLNAWFDFDGNGVWTPDERVFDDLPLAPGTTTLTEFFGGAQDGQALIAPSGTTIDTGIAARFRWGPELDEADAPVDDGFAGLVEGGGEVEDYLFSSIGFNIDPNFVPSTGDYDGDGLVNSDDFAMFAGSFGATAASPADGNLDGLVNAADFTILRDSFNSVAAAPVLVAPSITDETSTGLIGPDAIAPAAAFILTPSTATAALGSPVPVAAQEARAADDALTLILLDDQAEPDDELLTIDRFEDPPAEEQEDAALALALEQDWSAL